MTTGRNKIRITPAKMTPFRTCRQDGSDEFIDRNGDGEIAAPAVDLGQWDDPGDIFAAFALEDLLFKAAGTCRLESVKNRRGDGIAELLEGPGPDAGASFGFDNLHRPFHVRMHGHGSPGIEQKQPRGCAEALGGQECGDCGKVDVDREHPDGFATEPARHRNARAPAAGEDVRPGQNCIARAQCRSVPVPRAGVERRVAHEARTDDPAAGVHKSPQGEPAIVFAKDVSVDHKGGVFGRAQPGAFGREGIAGEGLDLIERTVGVAHIGRPDDGSFFQEGDQEGGHGVDGHIRWDADRDQLRCQIGRGKGRIDDAAQALEDLDTDLVQQRRRGVQRGILVANVAVRHDGPDDNGQDHQEQGQDVDLKGNGSVPAHRAIVTDSSRFVRRLTLLGRQADRLRQARTPDRPRRDGRRSWHSRNCPGRAPGYAPRAGA